MNSPITQAELLYQQRGGRRGGQIEHKGLRRLGNGVLIAGLFVSLALFALELWSILVRTDLTSPLVHLDVLKLIFLNLLPLLVLLPLTVVFHFGLLLRTLMLSSNVIRREQLQNTWQLLRLTKQSAAQVVINKWLATVRNLALPYLLLAGLRIGVIVFVGLELYRFDYFYFDRNSVRFFLMVNPLPFAIYVGSMMIAAALIALFSFANLAFTAALGVLVSAVRRGGHTGDQVAIAFVLRTVLLGLPALLLFPQTQQSNYYASAAANTLMFSLLDNGTLVSAAYLTAPRHQLNFVVGTTYSQFYPPDVIPLVFGFYALIMMISLGGAVWFARRS